MPATKLTETGRLIKNFVDAVTLPPSKDDKIATLLSEDLAKARAGREPLDGKIMKWEKQYEAQPDVEVKTFPWRNASNVVAPLIAIDTDAVVSRVEAALVGQPGKDMVQAKALRKDPETQAIAEPLARYLNHAARDTDDLDTEACLTDLIPDTILNGLSFMKIPVVYEEAEIPVFNEDLSAVSYQKIVKHNGPKHVWVSMTDMLWPAGTTNIQTCRWIAQRFFLEWWELLGRVQNPMFGYRKSAVDKLKAFLTRERPDLMERLDQQIGFTWEPEEALELYEVYIRGDFEQTGDYREYIITIHPESGTILKFVRNFYAHQKRPFIAFVFEKRRRSILGAGMGQMLERLQDGITASLNQMIDNSTAANTVVLKVKEGAIKPGEEIYPMKKLIYKGEKDDVEQFRLGENSTGMVNSINILRDFAERRSKVTDYTLGMESSTVGTRATAAGTLSLIQEGNKQIDRHIRLFRLSMNQVWEMTIQVYQQFAPTRKIIGLLGEDAAEVIEEFSFPSEWIFNKISVTAAQTSQSANREIEQQNAIQLFNMLQAYYEKMLSVAQVYSNPMLPPLVKAAIDKAAIALNELLAKIMKSFEFYDADNFIIVLAEIEQKMMLAAQAAGVMNGGNPGGAVGPGVRPPARVLPGQPGMAGPPAMAAGAGGNGNNGVPVTP